MLSESAAGVLALRWGRMDAGVADTDVRKIFAKSRQPNENARPHGRSESLLQDYWEGESMWEANRITAPPSARFDASANSLPVLRSLITNVLFFPSVDHGPRDTSLNSTKRQSVTSFAFNPR
jgi:hypothetical protein